MNGRQNDQLFIISIIVLLLAYSIIGANPGGLNSFWLQPFDLSVFGKDPDQVSHYDLRFHEINGQAFEDPLFFDDAAAWLENENIVDGRSIINRLGIALHQENSADAEDLHTLLVSDYLSVLDSAEYEIVFLVVNPVEKYSRETFVSEETIGIYSWPSRAAAPQPQLISQGD